MEYTEIRKTQEYIDPTTGEIVRTTSTHTNKGRSAGSDGYVCLYDEGMGVIAKIKSISTMRVLFALMVYIDYNRGVVRVTKGVRSEVTRKAGVSQSSYYAAIKELQGIGLLEERSGDLYFNAQYLWKGTSGKRVLSMTEICP